MRSVTLLVLLAGCNPVPHVNELSAVALPCGAWALEVQGGGVASEARLRVDGVEQRRPLDEDGWARFGGSAEPGARVDLEVSVGGAWRTRTLELPSLEESPLRLPVSERPMRLAGLPQSFVVEADATQCERRDYSWQASLEPDGFVHPLSPLPERYTEERLTSPPLKEGLYTLSVQVVAPWGVVQSIAQELEVVSSYDADGDGVNSARAPGGGDCDDADPEVPSGGERGEPNAKDDDCDGFVDEGTDVFDDDRDSYSERQGDCDDGDPKVSPLGVEKPDGVDQDCDGVVDE